MGAFRFHRVAGALRSRVNWVASLILAAATAACAGAPAQGLHATPPGLGRLPYTDADVDFMAGMIPHHAQAVIMADHYDTAYMYDKYEPHYGGRAPLKRLDELPLEHDDHSLSQTSNYTKIMSNPDNCHAQLATQPFYQFHDLSLDGNVQRCRRLIRNQHLRTA
jgi:hypothetical protein